MRLLTGLFLIGALVAPALAAELAPWGTFRGNPQRTGNTDGQAGPAKPAVRWIVRARDHFVASPVAIRDGLYVAGIGTFNRPTISLVRWNRQPPETIWSKTAPLPQLPTVSSPAVAGDYLLFGDGMHQDAGGTFYCLDSRTGFPIWQFSLSGELIHMEGGPLVVGNHAYIGAGGGGVLCVEWDKAVLNGKEYDLPAALRMQQKKWEELQAKFATDKQKDPDLAFPPDESQLLPFTPKRIWHKGQNRWHVDAPINAAGELLLVPSSYLDKEKVGERALYALNRADGSVVWKTELSYNPWGGATVVENTVLVPGSSIGYYLKELKMAKGDLTALDLKTGQRRWRQELPSGGIVGCVAAADGLAIATATDGRVRAYAVTDGERRWTYDCKTPIFAPAAIAAGVVYVADLHGTVHALNLKTGNPIWTFATAPAVGNPGMVYAGPIVHNGQIFVVTCNLEGPNIGKPTAIVCLGNP